MSCCYCFLKLAGIFHIFLYFLEALTNYILFATIKELFD